MKEEKKGKGVSRRDFMKIAGAGGIAAGSLGPAFLFPERAAAQQKTLKILQWSHFVPAFDEWFNKKFAVEWGQKHNTNVVVDNINLVDLNTRAASEAQAKKGHDLFMFLSPPAAYENQVIDMTHVYQEVEKKHGKKIDLAHKSTFNPKTTGARTSGSR
jgi:multiple sugar transport system substrate-binding protein